MSNHSPNKSTQNNNKNHRCNHKHPHSSHKSGANSCIPFLNTNNGNPHPNFGQNAKCANPIQITTMFFAKFSLPERKNEDGNRKSVSYKFLEHVWTH